MNDTPDSIYFGSYLHSRATLAIALAALVLLTPFAISNFVHGRAVLGAGSLLIILLLAGNAWEILRGRYHPLVLLLGLVPAVLFFLTLFIRGQGMEGVLWTYPALIGFYFILSERQAWLANAALLGIIVPQILTQTDPPLASRAVVTLLTISVFSAVFVRIITDLQRVLKERALTDPLTGLANRASLINDLRTAAEQKRRSGVHMTLIALDVDHFKQINDAHGHSAGDAVLRGIGQFLAKRIRATDKAYRIGGEEFLVLLYAVDAEHGRSTGETLRQAIEGLPLLPEATITTSVGVATLQPEEDVESWLKRSDANLYRAKSAGRNRVVG